MNPSMTENIVPITDKVPEARAVSANQPPAGARRRTSNLTVIAVATTRARISKAVQRFTDRYSRRARARRLP